MLKKILILNALFSLANTVIMLGVPQMMVEFLFAPEFSLFGISAGTILRVLAIGLFGFAAYVSVVAYGLPQYISHAKIIIIADWLWVISTLLLFIFAASIFSVSGLIFFAIVAFIVMVFALAQRKYLNSVAS